MMLDRPAPPSATARERVLKRWHAVTVTAGENACAAAKACKGKRFLSKEAPSLPLEGCDSAKCHCKYRHFDDRRAAPRRRDEAIGPSTSRATAERRKKGGRRAED